MSDFVIHKSWITALSNVAQHAMPSPRSCMSLNKSQHAENVAQLQQQIRHQHMCSWLTSSCTSCNPGYAFLMLCHKSKTGKCLKTKDDLNILCGNLDEDESTGSNTICTKTQVSMSRVKPIEMFPKGSREFEHQLLKPARGHHEYSVAKCHLWKQTVCRSGSCHVKKEVECLEVYKIEAYPSKPDKESCDSKYCTSTTSAGLCKRVAMMV